jgi:hypothetical protein
MSSYRVDRDDETYIREDLHHTTTGLTAVAMFILGVVVGVIL